MVTMRYLILCALALAGCGRGWHSIEGPNTLPETPPAQVVTLGSGPNIGYYAVVKKADGTQAPAGASASPSSGVVPSGSVVRFTINITAGWTLTGWTVNGQAFIPQAINSGASGSLNGPVYGQPITLSADQTHVVFELSPSGNG